MVKIRASSRRAAKIDGAAAGGGQDPRAPRSARRRREAAKIRMAAAGGGQDPRGGGEDDRGGAPPGRRGLKTSRQGSGAKTKIRQPLEML